MSNILDNNQPNESGEPSASPLSIEIVTDDPLPEPDWYDRIRSAVTHAATLRGYSNGEIGIRVTNDAEIRLINARHLDHDYETDVISFAYADEPPTIEGELVVSLETAQRVAERVGWSVENELLLYVVHGTLHIAGMDDLEDDVRIEMRAAECQVMKSLGIEDIVHYGPDRIDVNVKPSSSPSEARS
ncbi:rRNA maturation RNase YbeY [Novipirellula sp. SH528]|uniref:rRNA maturation RNase YbeY n=1 Tax=Novipirellula sp. SH528 TaxID=3454466 RepID=UPI003FA11731